MEKSNIRKLAAGLCLSASLFIGQAVQAAAHLGPPSTFEVQGKLLDADGVVVPDGDYDFSVAIGDDDVEAPTVYWPEQGEELTLEDVGPVTVTDGIYNFTVGPVDPAILADNSAYLWVFLDGETFGPQDIQSVPYAIVARTAVSANSVADGSITAESLAPGAVTAESIAPGTIGDVFVDEDGTITLQQTIDSVSTLRDVVKPVVDSTDLDFTVATGVAIDKDNPFGVSSAVFYNAVGGGSAPSSDATINVTGLGDTGLVFDTDANNLSGTATTPGVYPFSISITDFLGQNTTLEAVLTVIDVELIDLESEVATGENQGSSAAPDGNVFAGDDVAIKFKAVESDETDPADEIGVNLSDFTLTVHKHDGGGTFDVSDFNAIGTINGDEDGNNSFTIEGVEYYTEGYTAPTANDAGDYTATMELSFDQLLVIDQDEDGDLDVATIGMIDKGFNLANSGLLTYEGQTFTDNASLGLLAAGSDTDDGFEVAINRAAGFNGIPTYTWFRVNEGASNPENLKETTVDDNIDTLGLTQVIWGVDGRAYTNGQPNDQDDPEKLYFAVVDNGFADRVTSMPYLPINDNINVADVEGNKEEFGGYSVEYTVFAGATNEVGEVTYDWKWINQSDQSEPALTNNDEDTLVIPGSSIKDIVSGSPDYEVFTTVSTVVDDTVISSEDTEPKSELTVLTPVLEVPGESGIVDGTNVVDYQLIQIGESATLTAKVYVPSSLLSDQDNGEWIAGEVEQPEIDVQIRWYLQTETETIGDPATDLPDFEETINLSLSPTETYESATVAGETDRAAVVSSFTLQDVEQTDNNNAEGWYWFTAETDFGRYTSEPVYLDIDPVVPQ